MVTPLQLLFYISYLSDNDQSTKLRNVATKFHRQKVKHVEISIFEFCIRGTNTVSSRTNILFSSN